MIKNFKSVLLACAWLCLFVPLSAAAVRITKIGPGPAQNSRIAVVDGMAILARHDNAGFGQFFEILPDNTLRLLYVDNEAIRGSQIVAVVNGNVVAYAGRDGDAFYWIPRGGVPQRISPALSRIPSKRVAVDRGRVLFFGVSNIGEGLYGWLIGSDDTASLIADLRTDELISVAAAFLGPSNNGLLFAGFANSNSVRLWSTDGTSTGTALVPLNTQVSMQSGTGSVVAIKCSGKIVFGGWINGNAGVLASDGSAAGTRSIAPSDGDNLSNLEQFSAEKVIVIARTPRVADCNGAAPVALSPPAIFRIAALAKLPQGVLFAARETNDGLATLWFGAGNRESTQVRADVFLAQIGFRIGVLESAAYFGGTTDTGANGQVGLWRTDGTAAGTMLVPGSIELGIRFPGQFANDQTGALFFTTGEGNWVVRPDAVPLGQHLPVPLLSGPGIALLLLLISLFATLALQPHQR